MARAWGDSEDQKAHFEFNARNVLTLWGPNGEIAGIHCDIKRGVRLRFEIPSFEQNL
jgi:hypothetical protein